MKGLGTKSNGSNCLNHAFNSVQQDRGQSDSYCYSENIKIVSCNVIPKHFCTETSSYHVISLISY